ncbi:MAG TPA: BREX system P-loop protein BrxC, partial [Coriobacteriia bacterium]|nr:BREX system P-loop protein BrxC [Coriobacteriia bacterium]
MQNREVFSEDPTKRDLPNLGVARVSRPETDQEWDTLHFELSHFVCEGEYERGLDRILSTFLSHLGQPKQPAAWVSGFYGSGKSHFLRVLENLWSDTRLPDGSSARGITHVSDNVKTDLLELTNAGKRDGGLWAAAGTLGTGASGSVRLAFLRVLFEAAGLPGQYAPAQFVIWLKQQGIFDEVVAGVESRGKSFAKELTNLYVAQALPEALLAARPDFASDGAAVRGLLKEQFPNRSDIDEGELVAAMRDVLELQSSVAGRAPLTLIVLDELQQFIGEDSQKTLDVDSLAQAISQEFESRVLLVAAGQSAMGATQALQKLKDRFTVYVQLSDTDVETVIRNVVLRKKPDKAADLATMLDSASGEIGRHLGGSKLAATGADGEVLQADYPILPTRRRFWEHVLRALDKGGTQSQLRTQLRMAQEAAKSVGNLPLGHVVGADFIFDQQSSGMLQSGVLPKDSNEDILKLRKGGPVGELQSRIAAVVFMIDRLREVNAELGVLADATTVSDLLVLDLTAPSAGFRNEVSEALTAMADAGRLAATDGAFSLVNEETQKWLGDFKACRGGIEGDAGRVASAREEAVRAAVADVLKGLSLAQGKSKTPRRIEINFGAQPPVAQGTTVPVWVRAEWDVTEKKAREEAAGLGNESPVVNVLLPKTDAEVLRAQLVRFLAARETVESKAVPTTEEGIFARKTIESQRDAAEAKVREIIGRALTGAKVFLPAGSDDGGGNLRAAVQSACEKALVRLFPRFGEAD